VTHEIVDFHKGLAEPDVVARYPRLFATEPLAEEGKGAHSALAAFRAKTAPISPAVLGRVVTAEIRKGGDKWQYSLDDPLPEFRIRSTYPPKRAELQFLQHCSSRVHSGARETLKVVLAHRLHLRWRRSNAAQLRADAKASGSLAEK
jgi:hypothetical protein